MKESKPDIKDDLRPEYDLKSLPVRRLGPGRKSFGGSVVRLESDVAEAFPTLIDTAMQIIKDENAFFVKEGIDDSEHIPRIIRIAESAGKLLSVSGMSRIETDGNVERIIQFGRQLFVDEWMKPFAGESEPPCEEDAITEFNLYLKKKKKSSNKRLKPSVAMGKSQGE